MREEHGLDIEWRQGGYMYVAYDRMREKSFKDLLVAQKSAGLDIDWIGPDRIASLAPGINPAGLMGGTFSPRDGYASPLMTSTAFHALAMRAGVDFRFGETLRSFRMDAGEILSLATDREEYSAPLFVDAAGADASEVAECAGLSLPVHPDCHEAGVTEAVGTLYGTDDRRHPTRRGVGKLLFLSVLHGSDRLLHHSETADMGQGQGLDFGLPSPVRAPHDRALSTIAQSPRQEDMEGNVSHDPRWTPHRRLCAWLSQFPARGRHVRSGLHDRAGTWQDARRMHRIGFLGGAARGIY